MYSPILRRSFNFMFSNYTSPASPLQPIAAPLPPLPPPFFPTVLSFDSLSKHNDPTLFMIGSWFFLTGQWVDGRCGLMPSYLVFLLTDRWLPKLRRREACWFVYRQFNLSCVRRAIRQLSAISLAHSRQWPGGWDTAFLCWMSDREKALQLERKGREDMSLPGGSGRERRCWGGVGGGYASERLSRRISNIDLGKPPLW